MLEREPLRACPKPLCASEPPGRPCPAMGELLDLNAKQIRIGFWQLSSKGRFVNLSQQQMDFYRAHGRLVRQPDGSVRADTGYPRLDRVLDGILENLLRGPDGAEDNRGGPMP